MPGAEAFDASQSFTVHRLPQAVLWPTRDLVGRVREAARQLGAELVVLDPALPLGLIGPRLGIRYAVVVHGAEIAVPARLPGNRQLLASVLRQATHVVAAGRYALGEARRASGDHLPGTVVPPGVDVERFRPLDGRARERAREAAGLPLDGRVVVSVSRLVPRKGMDVLIAGCSLLARDRPDLVLAIAGTGRDEARLRRLAQDARVPVYFLGRVPDDELPVLLGSADVFAMLCRTRWGGLEQEGFGIVFLEAAACGVPQVAGDSGGAAEAVVHGETGFVVGAPADPAAAVPPLAALLDDADLRQRLGMAARRRAEKRFSYDRLATNLDATLQGLR